MISMKSRRMLGIVVVLIAVALFAYRYLQYQSELEWLSLNAPFEAAVGMSAEYGERALEARGIVEPNRGPKEACTLEKCADVKSFSIAEDGTMNIVLSGKTLADLEGRTLILTPRISDRRVTWTCKTDAPPHMVPSEGNILAMRWPRNVNWCTRLS